MNSDKKSKFAIGRTTLIVMIVAIVIVFSVAATALLIGPSTTSTTTISSSQSVSTASNSFSFSESKSVQSSSSPSITSPCTFSPPIQEISTTENLDFSECLTGGSGGAIHLVITNQNGLILGGSVKSQYPVGILINIFPVSDYYSNYYVGQLLFTHNDTVAASFSNLSLIPATPYEISVTNQVNQNNSVTINLQLS